MQKNSNEISYTGGNASPPLTSSTFFLVGLTPGDQAGHSNLIHILLKPSSGT